MKSFTEKLFRTKTLERDLLKTDLKRCLSTLNLTLIGIGSMVGGGMYVLIGNLLSNTTGPATILSFFIAGIVSLLSAWCYAEFGARIPKTGSAYVYTYITVGELVAFVIGWNLILEHVTVVAGMARCLIGYLDELFDNVLLDLTPKVLVGYGIDPFSCLVVILVAILVCSGVKVSVMVSHLLSVVNISVALFVIFGGVVFSNASNWTYPDGFTPFGVSSVFEGAAKAYVAFVGYDSIAIASEEAKNPAFSVPFALGFAVIFVTILYCSVAAALASMLPYTEISANAAFADVFDQNDWPWAKYVVSVGATGAMACVILAFLMIMPRCVYAMASDGLIFKKLAKVNSKTHVPVLATVLGSVSSVVFALFMSLDAIIELVSIATLLACMIVAFALIVYRYSPRDVLRSEENESCTEESQLLRSNEAKQMEPKQILLLVGMLLLIFAMNALIAVIDWVSEEYRVAMYIVISIVFLLTVIDLTILTIISKDNSESSYCRVPFVPFVPAFSIAVNCYLMMQLSVWTWMWLAVWMAVGFLIYFFYGIKNSSENDNADHEKPHFSHVVKDKEIQSIFPDGKRECN